MVEMQLDQIQTMQVRLLTLLITKPMNGTWTLATWKVKNACQILMENLTGIETDDWDVFYSTSELVKVGENKGPGQVNHACSNDSGVGNAVENSTIIPRGEESNTGGWKKRSVLIPRGEERKLGPQQRGLSNNERSCLPETGLRQKDQEQDKRLSLQGDE